MYYDLVTGPASEPVSLDEAKFHCKVDEDNADDDIYINSLIKAARAYIEKLTGYVCVSSTWALYMDEWPAEYKIYILKSPVTSISKVEYYADDDAVSYTELSSADYDKAEKYNPPCVLLDTVPTIGDRLNAIKVTFIAGHANTVDDPVPEIIKQAIKILVLSMYQNRQAEVTGTIVSRFDIGFEYLLEQIKLLTP